MLSLLESKIGKDGYQNGTPSQPLPPVKSIGMGNGTINIHFGSVSSISSQLQTNPANFVRSDDPYFESKEEDSVVNSLKGDTVTQEGTTAADIANQTQNDKQETPGEPEANAVSEQPGAANELEDEIPGGPSLPRMR